MKKIVRVVLLACVLAVGIAVSSVGMETVRAEEKDELIYESDGAGGITITNYKGSDSVLEIDGSGNDCLTSATIHYNFVVSTDPTSGSSDDSTDPTPGGTGDSELITPGGLDNSGTATVK